VALVRIDHVIYGTSDLDRAAARFQAEGLNVEPGGCAP
jgi:glyoxalase-like protein